MVLHVRYGSFATFWRCPRHIRIQSNSDCKVDIAARQRRANDGHSVSPHIACFDRVKWGENSVLTQFDLGFKSVPRSGARANIVAFENLGMMPANLFSSR